MFSNGPICLFKRMVTYEEQPIRILGGELKLLHNIKILLVKELWHYHKEKETMWELESEMCKKYPHFCNIQLKLY